MAPFSPKILRLNKSKRKSSSSHVLRLSTSKGYSAPDTIQQVINQEAAKMKLKPKGPAIPVDNGEAYREASAGFRPKKTAGKMGRGQLNKSQV